MQARAPFSFCCRAPIICMLDVILLCDGKEGGTQTGRREGKEGIDVEAGGGGAGDGRRGGGRPAASAGARRRPTCGRITGRHAHWGSGALQAPPLRCMNCLLSKRRPADPRSGQKRVHRVRPHLRLASRRPGPASCGRRTALLRAEGAAACGPPAAMSRSFRARCAARARDRARPARRCPRHRRRLPPPGRHHAHRSRSPIPRARQAAGRQPPVGAGGGHRPAGLSGGAARAARGAQPRAAGRGQ